MNLNTIGFNFYPECILAVSVHNTPDILEQDCSDYYKIIYIDSGISHITINDSDFILSGPQVLCINELDKIEFNKYKKESIRIILFNPSFINTKLNFSICNFCDIDSNISHTDYQDIFLFKHFKHDIDIASKILQIDVLTSSSIIQYINNLNNQLVFQETPFWTCRSRAYLMEMLFSLANPIENDDSLNTIKISPDYSKLTIDVITYLQSSYNQKLSSTQMARIFHTNRTTLLNEFKKNTGVSLSQYLAQKRFRIATALLRDTDLTISEICERTGFSDVSYFSKAFKKEISYTPSEYRHNITKS